MNSVNIKDQIKEVKRVLKFNAQMFPKWVSSGHLPEDKAQTYNKRMAAILETLEAMIPLKSEDADQPSINKVLK